MCAFNFVAAICRVFLFFFLFQFPNVRSLWNWFTDSGVRERLATKNPDLNLFGINWSRAICNFNLWIKRKKKQHFYLMCLKGNWNGKWKIDIEMKAVSPGEATVVLLLSIISNLWFRVCRQSCEQIISSHDLKLLIFSPGIYI